MSEPTFANGQRVTIVGRLGTVRFCGNTQFAPGVWVGVELDEAVGKNSGTVKDVEYFRCPPERGIFVRPPMVQVLDGEAASPQGADSKSRPSTASGEATSPKGEATSPKGEATSPKGADSKSRPSTASGATGEATSPKGADSKSRPTASGKAASPKGADSKPRPSTASGEAASPKGPFAKPSRPSTASGSDGARREAKEKTETKEVPKKGEDKTENKTGAQKAATETSQGAEPAVEKVEEDKAAREKAAEKAAKAAAEKAPAEKAVAQKAAAEKAAAEKATAEKAAAEKAATEKAAAEKAAAEKGAAEKAAAEKAAAEKAAAEKVVAEKAAAEKAAEKAQKAAAEKVAAEKVAAEKEAAEKAAAERAAAEKAAAEKAAAEKAAAEKAAAEKAAAEKAAAEKAAAEKAAAEKAAAEKAAAEKAAEKAAAEKAAAEKAAAEKVLQAAETKRAEAAEKLRVMTMIRSKLKKKVENVQDQSQLQAALQEKLDASILGRLMAEERLEELKLELAEAELKRDEEAEEKAKFLVQMVNIPTPQPKGEATAPPSEDGAMAALMKLQNRKKKEDAPAPPPPPPPAPEAPRPNITRSPELDAYQEALRVLHQASQQEVDEMQKQIAILDQDSNKVPRLKTDLKTLNNRQNLLQERMADVEMEAIELEQAAKAGDELRDLRDSVVLELRQEVEQREERLQQLEDLVLKLDKERRRLQEEADRDALDAKDLMEEVMKLSNGDTQVHGRLATASVQLRLAHLDLATVKAKGAAFADCVPRTWQETTEAPSSASQSLSAALAIGACARAAERLLFRLEALGRHAAASGQRGAKLRMEMCEVACVAFRCAAVVASVLDAGLVGENTSIEATKKLEAQFKRVEQKTKELMHKKWPLDSPSQALNCLQEVETLTSEVLKGGLSVRGLCYQFQRFQVAFAYGVASKRATKHAVEAPPSEAAKPVQEEKVEEDGAMAALMRLQNRKKTPEEAPPEGPVEAAVAPAPVEQPQVELQPEDFQEDLWPEMELRLQVAQQTGGQHRAAESELQRLGKGIEVGLGKCATGEEEEPISFWRALKAASDYCQALLPPSETRIDLLSKNAEESLSRSSARLASEPPVWAASSLEVQSRVEEIDEKHREVQEAQEQLKEKKKLLSFSEEEMLKAEDRGKKLKAKLSAMIEAQQTSDALQAEEEQLRRDVAAKAQRQAQLVQQIEETKAKRDKLEQLYKDEEKKRKHLEESIDKMRQRPKQDEDGRATAPEFAALRLSQQKGARELYALQVSGMNDLVPLPESKEVSSAEECVQKYTTLRKSLLRHLSCARVQRLGVRNPEEEVFASRLQELHFQLSEARSSLNALGPLSPQAKTLEAKPGGEAAEALTMAFTLQPPRWAHMKVPKELYSSSWSDIREIHVAAA